MEDNDIKRRGDVEVMLAQLEAARGAPEDVHEEHARQLAVIDAKIARLWQWHGEMTQEQKDRAAEEQAVLVQEHERLRFTVGNALKSMRYQHPLESVHPDYRALRVALTKRNVELTQRKLAEQQGRFERAQKLAEHAARQLAELPEEDK